MKLKKRQQNSREYVGPRGKAGANTSLKHSKTRSRKKSGAEKKARNNVSEIELKRTKKKPKTVGGATRDAAPSNGRQVKWGRIILFPLLIVGLGLAVSKVNWQSVYDRAYTATNRPLASIKIESEFRYVAKEELQAMISKKLDGSFVDLDLRDVKMSLEENPWIQKARIERIWPDTMKLTIVEHRPIARWASDGFISREGELIKVASNKVLSELPLLSGSDDDSQDVAKNYLIFSELLKGSNLQISGLEIDEKLAWTISLSQGFTLVLGRGDIHSRLENFRYVYDKYLKDRKGRLARVDMRYEKGLAVSWKDNLTEEKIIATRTAH